MQSLDETTNCQENWPRDVTVHQAEARFWRLAKYNTGRTGRCGQLHGD
jgi:hypothetical protein